MTLTWNVVTKRITPHEQLRKKFRQKIAKLETHLQHFPPDAVHLQIALERHARKPVFTSTLTLRVPSNILHGTKKAANPVTAFDHSIRALLREVSSLKADLRRESRWHRPLRKPKSKRAVRVKFASRPLAGGHGPQNLADMVAGFLQLNHAKLLRYISRQIAHAETKGTLPRRSLDARAVVDEVARQALSAPERKPRRLTYPLWLYTLARRELKKRFKQAGEHSATLAPLRRRSNQPDDLEEQQRVIETIERSFEPRGVETEDWMVDNRSPGPDTVAASRDLLHQLQLLAAHWPKTDREVFELYFVEGFDPEEIAVMEKMTSAQVGDEIEKVQRRMRDSVLEAAQRVAPAP